MDSADDGVVLLCAVLSSLAPRNDRGICVVGNCEDKTR